MGGPEKRWRTSGTVAAGRARQHMDCKKLWTAAIYKSSRNWKKQLICFIYMCIWRVCGRVGAHRLVLSCLVWSGLVDAGVSAVAMDLVWRTGRALRSTSLPLAHRPSRLYAFLHPRPGLRHTPGIGLMHNRLENWALTGWRYLRPMRAPSRPGRCAAPVPEGKRACDW